MRSRSTAVWSGPSGTARAGSAPAVPRVTLAAALGPALGFERPARAKFLSEDAPAALTDYRDLGRHLGPRRAEPLAVEDQARSWPIRQGRGIVDGIARRLAGVGEPSVLGEWHAVAADPDDVAEAAHVHRLAAVADGDRVLIGIDAHETLAVHVATRYNRYVAGVVASGPTAAARPVRRTG